MLFNSQDYDLDQRTIRRLFIAMSSPTPRLIFGLLSGNQALLYTDILNGCKMTKKDSGRFSHHLRTLIRLNLIVRDRATKAYFLSQTGIKALKLTKQFEKFFVKYSMSDVNSKGKVKRFMYVERNIVVQ